MSKTFPIVITIQNPARSRQIPTHAVLNHIVKTVLRKHGSSSADITLRFVDQVEGASLNKQYRKKSGPTNVLSFPLSQAPLQGDIVICMPVVVSEARTQGKTIHQHLVHLVVHGVLHSLGFDHVDPKEAVQMETLEIQLLAKLGYPNPYHDLITHV